jgi:hypothetical protein
MKDFKPMHKMTDGNHPLFCGGGKVMRKAEGGSIRSQFNSAFREARNRGDKTFDFQGKKYTTDLAKPSKPMSGRAGMDSEVNDLKDQAMPSRPSMDDNDVVAAAPSASRPSMEENSSNRGMRVKTPAEDIADLKDILPNRSAVQPDFERKTYSMPGVRMGGPGEPAIVIGKKRGGMMKAKGGHIHTEMEGKKEGVIRKENKLQKHVSSDEVAAMAKGGGNWIAGAIKHKGALHRDLGVPMGQKIPAKKLAKAEHSSNPTIAKRARLAKTLASFKK